jgi:DNA-binding NarL/FixJ family response regulator
VPDEAIGPDGPIAPELARVGRELQDLARRLADEPGEGAIVSGPFAGTTLTRRRTATVAVVDHQALFRSGLVELLGRVPTIEVVGSAATAEDAVSLCQRTSPDVVLIDLELPGTTALDALCTIAATCPSTRVVVLTALVSDDSVLAALGAGASGYLLKDADFEAILAGISAVREGEQVLSAAVARRLTGLATPKVGPDGDQLTRRELEILRLIAQGEPNRGIAERLSISDKTVRNHVSHLYEKLAISTRSEAVLCAVRQGLVDL